MIQLQKQSEQRSINEAEDIELQLLLFYVVAYLYQQIAMKFTYLLTLQFLILDLAHISFLTF
jgi:hypothetical protein